MAVSVHPGLAASAGTAYLGWANQREAWQVQWQHVTLPVYGVTRTYYAGELLPPTPYAAEIALRDTLTAGGALRRVTAAATTTRLRALLASAAATELTDLDRDLADRGAALPDTASPVPYVDIGGIRYAGPAT